MRLNREDIKNLRADLDYLQRYGTWNPNAIRKNDLDNLIARSKWRKELIKSLEAFQKTFGWEKD